jgi:hypothetical protein
MTTVLAYATLLHLSARFPELLAIVADWLADRTSQPWTARRLLETTTWKHPLLEVRTATVNDQERTRWALRLKTRDARGPGRDWLIELALGDREQGGVAATVIVQAIDGHLHGLAVPAVPLSQPALVRAARARRL